MRARAKGMAISNTSNWICNFIVAFVTPPLFAVLHGGYYFILVGSCVISGVVVYFLYPETAHRTLEELGEVFKDGVVADLEKPRVGANSGTMGRGWLEVAPPQAGEEPSSSSSTLHASIDSRQKVDGSDAASKVSAN